MNATAESQRPTVIVCPCGLKLRPKFRGEIRIGQRVRIGCKCGRRLEFTATAGDSTMEIVNRATNILGDILKRGEVAK